MLLSFGFQIILPKFSFWLEKCIISWLILKLLVSLNFLFILRIVCFRTGFPLIVVFVTFIVELFFTKLVFLLQIHFWVGFYLVHTSVHSRFVLIICTKWLKSKVNSLVWMSTCIKSIWTWIQRINPKSSQICNPGPIHRSFYKWRTLLKAPKQLFVNFRMNFENLKFFDLRFFILGFEVDFFKAKTLILKWTSKTWTLTYL